jgi:HAD superfamily hydrolase (TIGR01509 family)
VSPATIGPNGCRQPGPITDDGRVSAPSGSLEAVLFDMDGTLVDSEKVWSVALTELAAHHGGVLSAAARHRMVGTSMGESMDILHTDLGRPELDVPASVVWLEDRMKVLLAEGVLWRPGAKELLDEVHAAGIPMALVTATRRHLVEVALLTIGTHYFTAVVTGDDVSTAKPHPEPYVTAARLVGATDVRNCVAIEDSPTGVASARAAGCTVLAVPCEVELSDVDGLTLTGSLADVDLAFLRKLVE